MKIRCSRCGKRFDADVYSGLCPKCGAYNGKHMTGYEEAERERAESEKAWRQEQPGPAPEKARADAFRESTQKESESGQNVRQSVPKKGRQSVPQASSKTDGKGGGKLLIAAVLIPIAAAIVFQIWKNSYFQERMTAGANIVQETGSPEMTVIEGGEMEYPLYVAALGMGTLPSDEVPEGWHLEGICVASSCAGYNLKEQISQVQLRYNIGDERFYRKTADLYDLEKLTGGWGIDLNELMTEYDFANGESMGYLVFLVRDGAADKELILELENDSTNSVTRQVMIPLDEADGLFHWTEWNVLPEESGVEE